MIQLEHDVAALRRLFDPTLAASGDTVIGSPDDSDQNAPFKRELIAKAHQILAAGESAVAGANFEIPLFMDSEFRAIESALAADQLKREFNELAEACRNVVQSLARTAA